MATDATAPFTESRIDTGGQSANLFDDGYFRIEHDNYYVACNGQPITLSLKEFLIISRLARNPERIVASEEIWRYAWGAETPVNPATLRVHINHLRHKLAPFKIRIESMVNVGYGLALNGHAPSNGNSKPE
jgi:two-component system, OmpR family, response regulator QseB